MEPLSPKKISRVLDDMRKRQENVPNIVNFPINQLAKSAIKAKNIYDRSKETSKKSERPHRSSRASETND